MVIGLISLRFNPVMEKPIDADAVPVVVAKPLKLVAETPMVGVLAPQMFVGDALFLGFGAPVVVKSDKLFSVSVQPLLFLMAEVVLERLAVGEVSEQFVAEPKPTKSITFVEGQLVPEVITVVVFNKATLPAVPERFKVPIASGVGKLVVPPVPAAP